VEQGLIALSDQGFTDAVAPNDAYELQWRSIASPLITSYENDDSSSSYGFNNKLQVALIHQVVYLNNYDPSIYNAKLQAAADAVLSWWSTTTTL
jgi:hypothetical protein